MCFPPQIFISSDPFISSIVQLDMLSVNYHSLLLLEISTWCRSEVKTWRWGGWDGFDIWSRAWSVPTHVCTCQQHPPGAFVSDFSFHFLSSCTFPPLHSSIKKRDSSPKNIAPVFPFNFSLWLQESGHCACAESLLLWQISMLLMFFSSSGSFPVHLLYIV